MSVPFQIFSIIYSYAKHMVKFCFFAFLFFIFSNFTHAADILLVPASASYPAGQTFTSVIQVDPKGDNVKGIEAQLTFDTSALSVADISTSDSVLSVWSTEPVFSNTDGTISFEGDADDVITEQSTLLTVTFETLEEGFGAVLFLSAHAADDFGSGISLLSSGGYYAVTPSSEPALGVQDMEVAAVLIDLEVPPGAPNLNSTVFPDSNLWYNTTEGVFSWNLPSDVTRMAVELTNSPDNVPTTIADPLVEEFVVRSELLVEGVQYLSIQFKNEFGWGEVTNRELKIDTIDPDTFSVYTMPESLPSEFPSLVFETQDETSGIEYFEVAILGKVPFEVSPEDGKNGYKLSELEDGVYPIKVTAYDKAGNSTENSISVTVNAGWSQPQDIVKNKKSAPHHSKIDIFVLMLIIIFEFLYILYERNKLFKKEEKIRKETMEVQDQMQKIFSALRDEIYDQINNITKRPRLSKKEKEAVDGLNKALEVSETLIEKEIKDVKQMLTKKK